MGEQWTEYKVTRHTHQPKTDLKMQILQIILFTLAALPQTFSLTQSKLVHLHKIREATAILTTQRILQTTPLTRLNNFYKTPVFYLVNLIIHHQHSVDEMISIILIEPL